MLRSYGKQAVGDADDSEKRRKEAMRKEALQLAQGTYGKKSKHTHD